MTELPLPDESHLRPATGLRRYTVWWPALIVLCAALVMALASGRGRLGSWPFAVLFVVLFGYFFWRGRRWTALHRQGAALLGRGDAAAALPFFDEAARRGVGLPAAVSIFHLGVCRLLMGEPARALALFGSAERGGALQRLPAAHVTLPGHVATCYALQGDVAAARAWLEEGERRHTSGPPPFSLLPQLLVLAREGRHAEVVQLASEHPPGEEATGPLVHKLVQLVHAFALWRKDGPAAGARVTQLLAEVAPVQPGELDSVARAWPEMRHFLEERGLVPA